jgi:DNA-binding response OmpR family regulator
VVRTYKILIADDSTIEAEQARRVLEMLPGALITVVEDGAAAVREAKNTRFDLLLVDYEMPALNGLQVVRLLRGTWSRLELPILMLTVRDDVQTKVLSLKQGASDYVTKPIQPEELLARVQAHLDLRTAVEENIKARMQILEGRKLETIGRLAAGLAHELNTPAQFTADNVVFLQKVLGASSELLERTRTDVVRLEPAEHPWADEFLEFWKRKQLSYLLAEAPKALSESLSGVMRMARIVKELEEFAGVPEKDWGLCDLNRALENTAYVSRQLWANAAALTFRLDTTLPPVICDATALKQAFFNILITLVESVDRASSVPRQAAQIEIESRQGESGIEVYFHCLGPQFLAMAPALVEGLGQKDGLGMSSDHKLALAHSVVVRQHHGELARVVVPGRDMTLMVRLPELQPSSARSRLVPGMGAQQHVARDATSRSSPV